MLIKRTAIIFLVLANIIILAHNFVPHHHDEAMDIHKHHRDHHDDKEETKDLFSNIFHGDTGFNFIINKESKDVSALEYTQVLFSLAFERYAGDFIIPPLLSDNATYLELKYQSPHSCSSGLRGPPSIVS